MHVLLIEDDKEAAGYVVKGLRESGHVVDHADNGESGLDLALSGEFDVLIVDRMLPERDGVSVVEVLREEGITTPILFLSALGEVADRVDGLQAGGDDYLTKPFAFSELLARIEALNRRGVAEQSDTTLQLADLEVNLLTRKVSRDGQQIDLQPREFRLLEYLLRHKGQVVTRTMLLEKSGDTTLTRRPM